MEKERRFMPGSVEIRGEGADRRIVGYAAMFNKRSVDLGGFVEELAPGAFDRALREAHDVRALVDHNPTLILGRTGEAGTLRLSVDGNGLRSEIDPPDTQAGRDIQVSLQRKDVTGMSFAFSVPAGGDEMKRSEDGRPLRIIKDMDLYDVSVVTYPAYPDTQVSMRALEQAKAVAPPVEPPPAPVERHAREIGLIERDDFS